MTDAAKNIPIELLKVSDATITFEFIGPFDVELMKDPSSPLRPDTVVVEKVCCSFAAGDLFFKVLHNGPASVARDPSFLTFVRILTNLDLVPAESGTQEDGRAELECRTKVKKSVKILSRRFMEYSRHFPSGKPFDAKIA